MITYDTHVYYPVAERVPVSGVGFSSSVLHDCVLGAS